jgi:hypothetical protein
VSAPYSETDYFAAITDPNLTTALWGAGTVDGADEVMKNEGYTAVDKFKTGVPYKWHSKTHVERRSDILYMGYMAYAKYVKSNVAKDVEEVVKRAINDLEDSAIPYMAHRLRPHIPSEVPGLRKLSYSTQASAQPPALLFTHVRYGYALKSASGAIGDILWQTWPPTELICTSGKDGDKDVFFPPASCKVTFAKDVWNKRAEDLAAKAEKEAKTSTGAPPTKIAPAYPTVARMLYRRLYKSLDKGDTLDAVADEEQIGMLLNNSPADDMDDTELGSKILPSK